MRNSLNQQQRSQEQLLPLAHHKFTVFQRALGILLSHSLLMASWSGIWGAELGRRWGMQGEGFKVWKWDGGFRM